MNSAKLYRVVRQWPRRRFRNLLAGRIAASVARAAVRQHNSRELGNRSAHGSASTAAPAGW